MAVSRKTNEAPKGVNLDRLPLLVERIEARKQKMDDARMDHASAWEEPKNLGFNIPPLKMAIKLRNMEVDKKQAWLEDFHEYCRKLGVYAQPSLFGEDVEKAGEQAAGATLDPFQAGKKAGFIGQDASLNPHDTDTGEHDEWLKGWVEGQAEKVTKEIKPTEPAADKPSGRGRRGLTEHTETIAHA